jgi:arylsulfatase A-like enzyme
VPLSVTSLRLKNLVTFNLSFSLARLSGLLFAWGVLAAVPGVGRVSDASGSANDPRPNFLIIMVDDLGFSDLGSFGAEIETPNLDALAENGVRFSQFYTTAKCHSSRISVLTGRHPFQAGGRGLRNSVTTAEMLRSGGYVTMMTGKWHLQDQPTDFGFDRYWGHLSGATNFFLGDDTFRLDGEVWQVPRQGFYTTTANVDFAIRFLEESAAGQSPWYLHIAFNAPHAPLQPLEEDYQKYLDRYAVGWDRIHLERAARLRESGLFQPPLRIPPRPEHIPAWKDLTEERRSFEQRRMAAYAGMIDRVDQELGRLFEYLRDRDEWENTFILFVSDNGACPYDRMSRPVDAEPYLAETIWSDSTGWAWARNTPFRFYKQNQHEGGIITAAIAHWPAGIKAPGRVTDAPIHLVDVLPTMSDLSGVENPTIWPERDLRLLAGQSFGPILRNEDLGLRDSLFFQFYTDRALREGDWKLVSFQSNPWELYRLDRDRTEMVDLAADHPEVVVKMAERWHELAETEGYVPARLRQPVRSEMAPGAKHHSEWTDFSRDPSSDRRASTKRKEELPEVDSDDGKHGELREADLNTFPDGTDTLDLFLLMGQSNMKGRGELPPVPFDDARIVMMHLENDQWYHARDPLHLVGEPDTLDGSDNAGVGPGLTFARSIRSEHTRSRIGLIPAAMGGANINLWVKGGRLYERAMRRAKSALAGGPSGRTRLRGIIWLQGESDARGERYLEYQEKLDGMIRDFREELGMPSLPFVASTVAPVVETDLMQQRFPRRDEINAILLGLPQRVEHAACIDARDLAGHIGDHLHYDSASQVKIGQRMAAAWLELNRE